MQKIDITGYRYGNLTVQYELRERKNNKIYYHCLCDCGNEVDVESYKLRTGHTKSCGCLKHESLGRKDFTGRRFGRLVVEEMLYSRYSGTKCKCRCDCGSEIIVAAGSLVQGITRSCGCLRSESSSKRWSKNLVGQVFGKLTAMERIRGENETTYYKCLCECGNSTIVDGRALVSGATQSCGCSTASHGESYIKSILEEMNIHYLPQYKFNDCVYKRPLPFDFFIPEYNLCIEYQGIQHYQFVKYFDKDIKNAEIRQERDRIKRNYCDKNNIFLIEIPYFYSKPEIADLLMNRLNP